MMTHYPIQKLFASCLACLSAAVAAQVACPTTAGRFVPNGAEVADSQTGLVWQRCSAGQSWSGSTCTGTAATYTHEAALTYAQTQNTANSTTGWRLPNVKELSSIADKGCQSPAIDGTAFPNTNAVYWSSSPYVGVASYAWYVVFNDGYVYYSLRGYTYAVRLVRASQ